MNKINNIKLIKKFYIFNRYNSNKKLSEKANDILSSDIIGPPDPVSNLRPILRHSPNDESSLQKKLREQRIDTQEWNQKFWASHNSKFYKERQEYISSHKGDRDTNLTAEEMSVFYKSFLDRNWKLHLNYNIEWYKRNASILLLSCRVNIEQLFKENISNSKTE